MTTTLTSTCAEALFASELATNSAPSRGEAAAAIRAAIVRSGGVHHPETAMRRMRWALGVAATQVSTPARHPARRVRHRAHQHCAFHRTHISSISH
jgi:hypothetical protein